MTITKQALVKQFDDWADEVLAGEYLKRLPRAKGQRQSFEVVKTLPDSTQYNNIRSARYTREFGTALEEVLSEFTALRDELQDWFDNLPESFQDGSKGEALQTAIDQLDNAENPPDIPDWLKTEKLVVLPYVGESRSERNSAAVSMLEQIISWLDDRINANVESNENKVMTIEQQSEAEEIRDQLEEIKSEVEQVEFPGMYA